MIMKIIKRIEQLQKNKEYTFTKKWVTRILWFGSIWISLSYVLAFMGRESIAEGLSQTVATVVIATIIGYLCKAFFETHSEENLKYKKEISKLHERNNENEDY